jgi:cytochrome c553
MKKIALSAIVALVLIGCGDNKSTTDNEVKSAAPQKAAPVEKVAAIEEKVTPAEEKVVVTEEKAVEAAAPAETKTEAVVEKAAAVPAVVDGAKLFTVCSSCHGAKGEKKALGRSQVIAGWDAAKTEQALKGYQDGSYGGAMKAVMQGQASKLSDAEIKALADYISKL